MSLFFGILLLNLLIAIAFNLLNRFVFAREVTNRLVELRAQNGFTGEQRDLEEAYQREQMLIFVACLLIGPIVIGLCLAAVLYRAYMYFIAGTRKF